MNNERWNNLSEARFHYLHGDPLAGSGPLEAFFEVSARCNLRCRMCAINCDTRYDPAAGRPAIFSPELFERLEPAFPTLLRAYLFGLGEPLLNPHLPEFARRLSDEGVEVWFNTNATLVDGAMAERLAASGVRSITVSIDGATARTYEAIRRGAKFERVMEGIRALGEAGRKWGHPSMDFSFVAMASNFHELPALVELCADAGGTAVHVEPLYAQADPQLEAHYRVENLGNLGEERVEDILAEARAVAAGRGIRLASRFLEGAGSPDYVERARDRRFGWTCSEPWSAIWVTAAGEVRTCCLTDAVFGNLRERPFGDIWNGVPFRAFRSRHASGGGLPPECANCRRNGRIRLSPYFVPVRPVTYRPLAEGLEPWDRPPLLSTPADGDTVTDPWVVEGACPSDLPLPDLWVDRSFRVPLESIAARRDGRFAALLELPFLSEGAHLVHLGEPDHGGDMRVIHVWSPRRTEGFLPSLGAAAVGRMLDRRVDTADIRLDGARWPASGWFRSRRPGGWYGLAVVRLAGCPPGPHLLTVRPKGYPASEYGLLVLNSGHASG